MLTRLVLGVALALTLAAPTVLAAPAGATSAEVELGRRRADWQSARAARDALASEHDTLAERIAALRRIGAKGEARGQLETLLRESVALSARVEAGARRTETAAVALRAGVAEAIRALDAEILRQKPGLSRGSAAERAATARSLKALIARRQSARDALAGLEAESSAPPRQWAQYQVRIDPLDGPEELASKADFLDDTRDKFGRKRGELLGLLAEARQARDVARAASNFQTDVRHFDDELRTGRVTRQSATALSTSDRGNPAPQAPSQGAGEFADAAGGGGGGASRGSGATTGAPGGGGAASPPPAPSDPGTGASGAPNTGGSDPTGALSGGGGADESTRDDLDGATGGGSTGGGATPLPSAVLGTSGVSGPLPRQLDPDALLNLSVSRLRGGELDVEALEALVDDLQRLDAYLRARAELIRQRAARLESDERRTLESER